MALGFMTALHVCLTTMGLGGLVSANAFLAAMSGSDREQFRRGVGYSLTLNRVFGPMLGLGILLGVGLIVTARLSPTTGWLLTAYALVVAGIAFQAAVAVPWQLRAMRPGDATTAAIDRRTPLLIAAVFALDFVAIVFVMVLKP